MRDYISLVPRPGLRAPSTPRTEAREVGGAAEDPGGDDIDADDDDDDALRPLIAAERATRRTFRARHAPFAQWEREAEHGPLVQHLWWPCLCALVASAIIAVVAATLAHGHKWRAVWRTRAALEARGLVCALSHRRPEDVFVARWPENPSGPTARALLGPTDLAALERAVSERGARAPRGHCTKAATDLRAAWHRSSAPRSDEEGEGGVIVSLARKRGVELRPEGAWGRALRPRAACLEPPLCLDASRPACRARGPLRVLWYGADPASVGRGAAATLTPRCAVPQCRWLRDAIGTGAPGGGDAVQLVTSADDACIFVFTPASVGGARAGGGADGWRDGAGAAQLTTELQSTLPDAQVPHFRWARWLPHWHAVGGVGGRNHVLVMPQCLLACEALGEPSALGAIGEAMVASPHGWRGLFRAGFDVQLPALFESSLADVATMAAAAASSMDGGRRSASAGRARAAERGVLISYRGTVGYRGASGMGTGRSRWTAGALAAAEWSHEPAEGVVVDVRDGAPGGPCGSERWTDDAAAGAAAGRAGARRGGRGGGGGGGGLSLIHI